MDGCDHLEWSPDVWNWNGSESEGLGFNLCVALSRIIMSLILEDGVGLEIGDSEMTSLFKTEVDQGWQERGVLWAGMGLRAYRGSICLARTWLQLMCCATRRLLSSNFGCETDEGLEVRCEVYSTSLIGVSIIETWFTPVYGTIHWTRLVSIHVWMCCTGVTYCTVHTDPHYVGPHYVIY